MIFFNPAFEGGPGTWEQEREMDLTNGLLIPRPRNVSPTLVQLSIYFSSTLNPTPDLHPCTPPSLSFNGFFPLGGSSFFPLLIPD